MIVYIYNILGLAAHRKSEINRSKMADLPVTKVHQWTRDSFLISTDPSLLDPKAINEAFASDALGWAIPLPDAEMTLMLKQSVCLAVYDTTIKNDSKPKQIGLARLITDSTTLAYLTDVYIHPDYQGKGLGHWLIQCVKEWSETMPNLRRVVLVASEGSGEAYYGRVLGAGRPEDEGTNHRIFSTRGPGLSGWTGHH